MNSEIAKLNDVSHDWPRAWVLYDGDCALCRKWVARFEHTLTVRGFDLAPLQSAWVIECLDLPEHELLSRMRVLTRDGRDYAGADALVYLARHVWWAWPLYVAAHFPFARPVLRRAYDFLARHRHCEKCVYTPQSPPVTQWHFKLFYDGGCPLCRREVRWLQRLNRAGHLAFEDASSAAFDASRYGATREELLGIIHGVFPDGRMVCKLEVFREAYRAVGLGWILAPTGWPGLRRLFDALYVVFARYRVPIGRLFGRSCAGGACTVKGKSEHRS